MKTRKDKDLVTKITKNINHSQIKGNFLHWLHLFCAGKIPLIRYKGHERGLGISLFTYNEYDMRVKILTMSEIEKFKLSIEKKYVR